MTFRLFCLVLFLPLPLLAQYDKILNDPDVIWAAEITLDFAVEPEFIHPDDSTGDADPGNVSVPLLLRNTGPAPLEESGVLLAPRLIALCQSAATPVFDTPEAQNPLDLAARRARLRVVTGANDSITVLDPVTLEAVNKPLESHIDPFALHFVRVRQLLFYRDKSDEFEVYTLAVAPLFRVYFDDCADCAPYYAPFWIKMPPYKPKQAVPGLNSPQLHWARRLTTRHNMPPLDSLRTFKNFKPPVMQQWADRARRDPRYTLRDAFSWEPLTAEARRGLLSSTDSIVTFDPETYEEKIRITHQDLQGADLHQVKLVQDWYWDDKQQQLLIRLHAFAPLLDINDEDGYFRFSKILCWRQPATR